MKKLLEEVIEYKTYIKQNTKEGEIPTPTELRKFGLLVSLKNSIEKSILSETEDKLDELKDLFETIKRI